MACLYIITNKVNGGQYVGVTSKTIEYRWAWHKASAKRGYNAPLANAIRFYGSSNFIMEVLFVSDDVDDCYNREEEYIQKYNTRMPNGYNVAIGGRRTYHRRKKKTGGWKLSQETKNKISKAKTGRKGRRASVETKEKMSRAHTGRISPMKGTKLSDETKQKISQSQKGIKKPIVSQKAKLRAIARVKELESNNRYYEADMIRKRWQVKGDPLP